MDIWLPDMDGVDEFLATIRRFVDASSSGR